MKIGNRRAPFIDYTNPGIFLVTINKRKELPHFSRVICNSIYPKLEVGVEYLGLGFVIYHALKNFSEINPLIGIRQYKIMPDHLHILLQIKDKMEKPLGEYIAILKRKIFLEAQLANVPLHGCPSVFEPGFNDQFLRYDRNLDVIYQYIKDNPRRLWEILKDPNFFTRVRDRVINNFRCSMYGNINHLANPFICDVVIHRRDTISDINRKKELWRYVLANGGVLAGAFIADAEKEIFKGAANYGGRIILISNKGYGEKEKPSKALFNLCSKGQLLIITPELTVPISEEGVSRAECLQLNSFAEKLSAFNGH